MSVTGQELGVPLYNLLCAGRKNLPTVAATYAEANVALSRTFDAESLAFASRGPCAGSVAQARHAWTELRDTLRGYYL